MHPKHYERLYNKVLILRKKGFAGHEIRYILEGDLRACKKLEWVERNSALILLGLDATGDTSPF